MTSPDAHETRSVVIEREMAHPPEKIWRALTQPHLIEEWLMTSDFNPAVGHRFRFTADWGAVDGKVLEIEAHRKVSYTWEAMGVETVVTWTLTPKDGGTLLRMEQTGFKPDQPQAYNGAQYGWRNFLGKLEQLLSRIE
ncbi:MAG: SRPBCC domain-containing protein [Hyphomonadaceae bacterium]